MDRPATQLAAGAVRPSGTENPQSEKTRSPSLTHLTLLTLIPTFTSLLSIRDAKNGTEQKSILAKRCG